MFGSQVLDTAIGLVALLFVLASASSALYELGLRLLGRRAKDLETALKNLIMGTGTGGDSRPGAQAWQAFVDTSVYQGVLAARDRTRPAYLSAKAFAEAVVEIVGPGGARELAGPLKKRVEYLESTVADDLTRFKAGLESWYDETMNGLTSRYRKNSAIVLLVVGFGLAVATNASVPHVAAELWTDDATRQAVVAAAADVAAPSGSSTEPADSSVAGTLQDVASTTDDLTELGLPVGWTSDPRGWTLSAWAAAIAGWLLTAVLVSLGAPFWYDLLGRLVAIRSPRPPAASDDPASATTALTQAESQTRSVAAEPTLSSVAGAPASADSAPAGSASAGSTGVDSDG